MAGNTVAGSVPGERSVRSRAHEAPAPGYVRHGREVVMDPALKESVIADLDRFLRRRDYYRRIGKAWKRGYLLYGPPGTGKSSLVAAMANYLRFNLYDLDPSHIQELLSEVEVTPAEVSEMLLRSEDPDVALQEFVEFLQDKKKQGRRTSK
ncbi:hypothetical protein SORBI_3002G319600 [Sorghum bicolor]|uniref:AAA+ ATPase At3g28540-like C-terminal domain-containing protein n=1 Tax=Sorghum bicolor TaxID=4558 RepID=C5XA21_SORBI|nr:hypothetical protein SORBI_3002G319600 [Sorghum bicolor]